MTDFEAAVGAVLDSLQPGDVLTYGEVAREAGRPGAARAVGGILARGDGGYPWWRVVTASGRLVPGHEREHARRLRAESVAVTGNRVVSGFRSVRRRPSSTPTRTRADPKILVEQEPRRPRVSSRAGHERLRGQLLDRRCGQTQPCAAHVWAGPATRIVSLGLVCSIRS